MKNSALKVTFPELVHPRLKLVERDCPKCDSVVIKNEMEECYECIKCGYIDCGDVKTHLYAVDQNG